MLAVIDRRATTHLTGAEPDWSTMVRAVADDVIEADGPDAVLDAVRAYGGVLRDILTIGAASTAAAALSAAWQSGAEWRTISLRHVGGPGLDPVALAVGLPNTLSGRLARATNPTGTREMQLVRIEDGAMAGAVLGTVFVVGTAVNVVSAALSGRGASKLAGVGRALAQAPFSEPDAAWTSSVVSVGDEVIEGANFLVASASALELGPLRVAGGNGALGVSIGEPMGPRDTLRRLASGALPVRSTEGTQIVLDTTAPWAVDGWSLPASDARTVRVTMGPTVRVFT